jgi:hypothetical protein
MQVMLKLDVEALGVFSLDNNPNAVEGSTLEEGVLIGRFCLLPDEGYTAAYDKSIAAEAAARVVDDFDSDDFDAAALAVAAVTAGALAADLVALDCSGPDMAGRSGDRLLDTFAFAGDDRMVRHLWSAGRHIVQNGRHVARDTVRARFAAVMARLATVL